jgi:hypothetical protein
MHPSLDDALLEAGRDRPGPDGGQNWQTGRPPDRFCIVQPGLLLPTLPAHIITRLHIVAGMYSTI